MVVVVLVIVSLTSHRAAVILEELKSGSMSLTVGALREAGVSSSKVGAS